MRNWRGQHKQAERGAALVEFALVVTLLLTLVLGIIEFGLIAMDKLTITQAAREGSRAASLGKTVSEIETRVKGAAEALDTSRLHTEMDYSTDNGSTYPFVLGDVAGENNAPNGSLIRITCGYPHHMITGNFFSWWSGVENGQLFVQGAVIMRRE